MYLKTGKCFRIETCARTCCYSTFVCAISVAFPVNAQDSPLIAPLTVPGDGFVDTMVPAVPGAQEIITDVPSPFFWSRHQAGQVGEWTYTVFPDGSGYVSKGDRDALERFRLTCIAAVACEIRSNDGATMTVPATGAPAPMPPTEITGETVASYLAEWILAGTGSTPALPSTPDVATEAGVPAIEDLTAAQSSDAAQPPLVVPVERTPSTSATEDASAGSRIEIAEDSATTDTAEPIEPADDNSVPDQRPPNDLPPNDGRILDLSVPDDIPPPPPTAPVVAPTTATDRPQPAVRQPVAETAPQAPSPAPSFAERANLRCSFTTSTSLSYDRDNESDGPGKLRANLGCSGNITDDLTWRLSLVEYANHAQQADFDPDFTYAFNYRVSDTINIGYSNYGGRYDDGLLDALVDGTLRASFTLPKLTMPNGRAISCRSGLGLPNPIDSSVSLSCGYSVTDKLRIGATANLYFPGEQGEFDPDYSYTASYRISDDWQLSYNNYSNNRFPWNRGESPGPGLAGGSLSLTYSFDF